MSCISGEALKVSPNMDFHVVVGLKSPSQRVKTFVNNLFASNSGFGSASGSLIMKINDCLERCSKRLRLVIPLEMIAKDVE